MATAAEALYRNGPKQGLGNQYAAMPSGDPSQMFRVVGETGAGGGVPMAQQQWIAQHKEELQNSVYDFFKGLMSKKDTQKKFQDRGWTPSFSEDGVTATDPTGKPHSFEAEAK